MSGYPASMKELIKEFGRMPGVGPKTAERYAYHILRGSKEDAGTLARAIEKVKSQVRFCRICNNLSDNEICDICSQPSRSKDTICIVEEPNDVSTIEKSGTFSGVYHVLLGSLSPLDGIGPSDLKIQDLIERIRKESFKEVIVATNFTTEGEATALYLVRALRPLGVSVSRVAYGIPVGGGLASADIATISKAFEGRREIKV